MKRCSSYFNMFGMNACDINKKIHSSSTSKMFDAIRKRHRNDLIVGERFINWVKETMKRNKVKDDNFVKELEKNFIAYIKSGNRIKLRNCKQRGRKVPKFTPEKESIEIDLTLPEQKTNEEYMAMISEGIMMGQDAKKKIDEALEGIRKNAYAKIMDAKVLEGIVKINKEKKQ